eukprot:scaffold29350_cov100-Isochrysis_galbana.AAC.2
MHPERGAGLVRPADQLKLQLHAPFSEHCARLTVPGLKLDVLATHLGRSGSGPVVGTTLQKL